VGGDTLAQGNTALNVRGVGLIGGGEDPVQQLLGLQDPRAAADRLRAAEEDRLREIRQIVLASVNNVPICVADVVEGGPVRISGDEPPREGVVVGYQTRLGKVSLSRPRRDAAGQPVRDRDGRVVWD